MNEFQFEDALKKFVQDNYKPNFNAVIKSNYGIVEVIQLEQYEEESGEIVV